MTNADKVHAINQLVGDHEMPTCWGFGKRRVKGAFLPCTGFPASARARLLSWLPAVAHCMTEELLADQQTMPTA